MNRKGYAPHENYFSPRRGKTQWPGECMADVSCKISRSLQQAVITQLELEGPLSFHTRYKKPHIVRRKTRKYGGRVPVRVPVCCVCVYVVHIPGWFVRIRILHLHITVQSGAGYFFSVMMVKCDITKGCNQAPDTPLQYYCCL